MNNQETNKKEPHNHTHDLKAAPRNRLWVSLIITLLFMFIEVLAGVLADSLALLSDAAHMLNDAASLMLALLTIKLLEKRSNFGFTYGYKRAEVFSGFINALSLIFIAMYILYEAFDRAINGFSMEVKGGWVFIVGIAGLIVNVMVVFLLFPVKEDSLNVEGAFQHVMADVLGSVGAIIAGLGILIFKAYWLDTVISLFIVFLISKNAISLLIRSSKVFLEVAPDNISVNKVLEEINNVEGVVDIHDFHAWILSTDYYVATAHITTNKLENIPSVTQKVHDILHRHGFKHVTVQVEIEKCGEQHDCVSDAQFMS